MQHSNRARPIDILLVEDNPGDVRLTQEAFKGARIGNDLHVVQRGDEALDYIHQRDEYVDAPRPDIVLLDLNLPGMNGIEVLDAMKDRSELRRIPVIMLTGSKDEQDIVESYENFANAYLTKPVDPDEFANLARSISEFWIRTVELPPAKG